MRDLPVSERPYEKCLTAGPQSLTDAELLAVILRSGTKGKTSIELAEEILSHSGVHEGLISLFYLSHEELKEIQGVGSVKAVQISCITELSRRIARTAAEKRLQFCSPGSIADYYMESLRHEEQEIVLCMMLDTKSKLIAETVISRGTVNISLISPRDVFLKALSYHAVQIILVHNHPSGDPTPSDLDIDITRQIREAGELLGILLVDHVIIGDMCFVSLREEHMIAGTV